MQTIFSALGIQTNLVCSAALISATETSLSKQKFQVDDCCGSTPGQAPLQASSRNFCFEISATPKLTPPPSARHKHQTRVMAFNNNTWDIFIKVHYTRYGQLVCGPRYTNLFLFKDYRQRRRKSGRCVFSKLQLVVENILDWWLVNTFSLFSPLTRYRCLVSTDVKCIFTRKEFCHLEQFYLEKGTASSNY